MQVFCMRTMCNIEYSRILRELEPLLGKHVNKAYDWGNGKLRFRIGACDLAAQLGSFLASTNFIEETPKEPTDFALQLRNRIENAKITSITQPNSDRLLQFGLSNNHSLIFEMFAKGNLILVKEGKCVLCYRREEWKGRKIAPKEPYLLPPAPQIKATLPSFDDFKQLFDSRFAISCLNSLPLGLMYAKELLSRSGIAEQKKGSELSQSELEAIYAELGGMLFRLSPMAYIDANGSISDYSLTPLAKYSGLQAKPYGSLSQAASEYYAQNMPANDASLARLSSLEHRLKEQEAALSLMLQSEQSARETARNILKKQYELDSLLSSLRSHSKLHPSELELLLKKHGARFERKKGKVSLNLG